MVSEQVKQRFNAGHGAELFFWRDNTGQEVDLVWETPQGLQAVEIKSGATFASDWAQAVRKWRTLAGAQARQPVVIYGGAEQYEREDYRVLGWRAFTMDVGALLAG